MFQCYRIDNYNTCLKYCMENNKNDRFNIMQFTKYIPLLNNDLYFYGLYENESLKCLSILKSNSYIDKCTFCQEIQCLESGKGYGKKLIDNICNTHKYMYFMCNPDAEESLHEYYIKNYPFLKELTIKKSVYNKELHFFYKIFDKKVENIIIKNLKQDYSK